jgi:hypothetical protein
METKFIERSFEKMGARVKLYDGVAPRERGGFSLDRRPFTLDIGQDENGEYFFIRYNESVAMQVLQVLPKDRHLVLMMTRNPGIKHGRPENTEQKSKFLCGHDERHWFVAAIPETEPVTTVASAKEALRPKTLPQEGNWIRQGEWFFVPTGIRLPKNAPTLHDEPLVRRTRDGRGGKPHIATECYRTGGEEVYVHARYAPQGFLEEQYKDWCARNPKEVPKVHFQKMVRNAAVYVRGEIRHPDHKTLKLGAVWHEVHMNRENESLAMASMVFLD